MNRRWLALVALACMASPALAAPKKKKGGKKAPPKAEEPAPAPEPEPTPAPVPVPESTESKPWADGVPQAQQDKARALYEEGNTLFGQQSLAAAYEKYKEAIKLWEHPLIRYNLAVTEIRLEKILDAAEDLDKALKWGEKPFKPELYQEALNYQALIKGQVGSVEVSCDQAGARLLFDGKPWLECPGTKKERVLAGVHAIVGEKKDYLTSSTKIVVTGDKVEKTNIKLVPLDSAVVLKYPYARWIPWTMIAAGVVIGVGGGGTWFLGKNEMDEYHRAYASVCSNGCEPGLTDPAHSSLAAQRDSAKLKGTIGISMMGVGGAVAVTGIILAIMNRPERVLPNLEVAPKGGGGIATVGWRF
jgi:hypothetical protein